MHSTLKGFAATLGLMIATLLSPAAAETPLVPLVSGLHHWDHHWYIWLPGDPVYEAVEVMAAERGTNAAPLVWVFFTERDGPKRQTHYYSDPKVAAAATGAQSRDIAFAMTGAEGRPRGVSVSLVDQAGRPVEIGTSFSPDAQLSMAGLTNQIGHSGDRMLLIFFRERNAFAQAWHVTIAGTEATKPLPGESRPTPFPAAYSSNIFVGYFRFDDQRVRFADANASEEKGVAHFTPGGVPGSYVSSRPDGSSVELVTGPDAALQFYRHRNGPHVLEISFTPPLPSPGSLTGSADSSYRISLDGFRDLLAGNAHLGRRDDAVILDWDFKAPDWTRSRPLRTTALLRDGSVTRVELRPKPAAQ